MTATNPSPPSIRQRNPPMPPPSLTNLPTADRMAGMVARTPQNQNGGQATSPQSASEARAMLSRRISTALSVMRLGGGDVSGDALVNVWYWQNAGKMPRLDKFMEICGKMGWRLEMVKGQGKKAQRMQI